MNHMIKFEYKIKTLSWQKNLGRIRMHRINDIKNKNPPPLIYENLFLIRKN